MLIQLPLLATPPHPCSYLEDRQARMLFVDPAMGLNDERYLQLLEQGFRRTGNHVYRPQCADCQDCVSLRVAVDQWRPRRIQRRIWNRIATELEVRALAPIFDPSHFDLYQRYIGSRHGDGDMANPDAEGYLRFLTSDWCTSRFVEFRYRQRLMAVAVTDYLPAGLSALYTFYEPELESFSPGVATVIWQIQEAARLQLPHLYLGYWIEACRKMAYKNSYRPNQGYINEKWCALSD